jgi:HlyD family secretion protein
MKKPFVIALVSLTAVAAVAAVVRWHERGETSTSLELVQVTAARNAGPAAAKALGRVEAASEEIGVSSDLTGRIAEILVEEGAIIEKGAPLARLEPFVYESRVEAAKAAVAQAVARRKLLEAGARRQEIDAARALLDETNASERLAKASWERTRQLIENGIQSQQQADAAREELEAARSRVKSAADRVALVENWTRQEELEAADAEIAQRRHELAVAEAELEKTVLRAPIAGTVVRKNLRVGEAVSALQVQPVVTIADMRDLRVRAEVDEIDIGRVRVGQKVLLDVLAAPEKPLHGTVLRLGKTMGRKRVQSNDPNEKVDVRVLEVLIDIDEPDELPLGLRLTVTFLDS